MKRPSSKAVVVLSVLLVVSAGRVVGAAELPHVAPAIAQLGKLHDSGVSEEVMLAYVQNSSTPKPNADELIYLHEAGVSKNVVTALLNRRDAAAQTPPAAVQAETPSNSEPILAKPEWSKASSGGPTIVMQQEPRQAGSTVIIHPAPPAVRLAPPALETYYLGPHYYPHTPYYSSPWYGYGPTFSIGFGLGHHFGGHFGHHFGHHGHHFGHHGRHWGHHGHHGGHHGGRWHR